MRVCADFAPWDSAQIAYSSTRAESSSAQLRGRRAANAIESVLTQPLGRAQAVHSGVRHAGRDLPSAEGAHASPSKPPMLEYAPQPLGSLLR